MYDYLPIKLKISAEPEFCEWLREKISCKKYMQVSEEPEITRILFKKVFLSTSPYLHMIGFIPQEQISNEMLY